MSSLQQYRLDELGWYQFEWLCQALLKVTLGVGVECWGGSSDLGKDAYCEGPLEFRKGVPDAGPSVFQAKFVAAANAPGAKPELALMRAVSGEVRAIQRRLGAGEWGAIHHYVLMTNCSVGAKLRTRVQSAIKQVLPQAESMIWGAADLSAMLTAHPNVRTVFPQLMGLQDLKHLLAATVSKPILERSRSLVEIAIEGAKTFASTTAYAQALKTLMQHGFVVLSGPPEVGKTTIARMIALAKLGEGWSCYECRRPEDILQAYDSNTCQVFVADDAFGSTEFRPEVAYAWGSDIETLLGLVDDNHWLLWTSRPTPLNAALEKMHLQGNAAHFPQPGQLVVDVAKFSEADKALILYRHAKAACLSRDQLDSLKRVAPSIIENDHFTPERIRRLVWERLPDIANSGSDGQGLKHLRQVIEGELQEPTTAMRKSFNALDEEAKRLLIALLDAGEGPIRREMLEASCKRLWSDSASANLDGVIELLQSHFIRVF